MKLQGRKIAVLIAPRGTEESEFVKPKEAIERAGGEVTVVSFKSGVARTVNHDLAEGASYPIDAELDEVTADQFDGLVVPGGCVGADQLRGNADTVEFVRKFFEQKKPVGVICHGPWVLVEAGVLNGRTLTSYPSVKTDIENAGGIWVDQEVVVDHGMVTSRSPDDLPAFCEKIVEEFCEGKDPGQAASL